MMLRVLASLAFVGCALGLLFGSDPQSCDNPIVNPLTGFTLNDIIDFIIIDTDKNQNGIIDIDEARVELLAQWSGGSDRVNKTMFSDLFSKKYQEDISITGQFFDNLDATGDGWLTEMDFILQIFDLGALDGTVSLDDFRNFIRKKHPHGSC